MSILTTKPIVVGVDGSSCSRSALSWAWQQSKLMNVALIVIAAWTFPTSYGWAVWPDDFNPEADAKAMLEEEVDAVVGSPRDTEVTTMVIEGPPALVLTEQSKSSLMIVVGSRGHRAFAGMLLGSVSEFLTTHAHCPVVVVR